MQYYEIFLNLITEVPLKNRTKVFQSYQCDL